MFATVSFLILSNCPNDYLKNDSQIFMRIFYSLINRLMKSYLFKSNSMAAFVAFCSFDFSVSSNSLSNA